MSFEYQCMEDEYLEQLIKEMGCGATDVNNNNN
jgi:hypothetical protein